MGQRGTARAQHRGMLLATFLSIGLIACPGHAKKEPLVADSYGPAPAWERFKELGEEAIRLRLVDPDSAKFTWIHGYVQRGYTPFMGKRVYGYATCGLVNSRNRYGGYAGDTFFTVVIDYDRVLYAEIDSGSGGQTMMGTACMKADFPLPPMQMVASAPSSGLGLTLTAVADGAYVGAVEPAGPSETAGIKPGMVIAQLNGVQIKGMDMPMINRLIEATSSATLTMVGGTSYQLTKVSAPAKPQPRYVNTVPHDDPDYEPTAESGK
jgi:hypothetical protein